MYNLWSTTQGFIFIVTSPVLGARKKQLSESEKHVIMKRFQTNQYPEKEEVFQVAKSLNISERAIRQWLKTYRHRKKRQEATLRQGEKPSVKYCQ